MIALGALIKSGFAKAVALIKENPGETYDVVKKIFKRREERKSALTSNQYTVLSNQLDEVDADLETIETQMNALKTVTEELAGATDENLKILRAEINTLRNEMPDTKIIEAKLKNLDSATLGLNKKINAHSESLRQHIDTETEALRKQIKTLKTTVYFMAIITVVAVATAVVKSLT